MIPRPKCATCPSFVMGSETAGTCRAEPPKIGLILSVVRLGEESPPEAKGRVKEGTWAKWPMLSPDSACCSLHPGYAAYAADFADSARREADDDINF